VLRLASASLLAVLFLAPAGCFYITPINERPRADIEVSPGPHYPGQPFMVQAFESSDIEDGVDIECTWSAYSCADLDCADPAVLEGHERSTLLCDQPYPVGVPEADHRPIRVLLTVADSDGATFDDETIIPIGNRPPVITGPQPQFADTSDRTAVSIPVRVSVEVDDEDGDEVAVSWRLIKPRGGGADVELQPVDPELDPEGLTQEFTPDVADVWTVEVTAADDAGEQSTSTAMVAVQEDGPPCIVQTLPAADPDHRFVLQRQDGPRTFSILRIEDELDPHPRTSEADYLGDPTFAWQLASPDTGGVLVPLAGASGPEVTIDAAAYAPGDLVDLRIEVSDRVERDIPCDPAQPTCSLSGDDCFQRVTWGVEIR
jgi:hypothetical protein